MRVISSAFLFLLCGAARLARFNITTNPVPKNPGRPDRKYFVGLPIPAAAGMVAAVVYAIGAPRSRWWVLGRRVAGSARPARVPDGEHLAIPELQGREPVASAIAADHCPDCVLIYLIWMAPQPVLLIMGWHT